MPRTATLSDWFTLFALTIFWGTSFVFIELALTAFPPSVLVLARIGLGALALVGFMLFSGFSLPRDLRTWGLWTVIALLGVILPMRLTAWGQTHISSAEAGVLMAISPLFVYTLAHFFLPGERITVARIVGFLVGFTGVIFVIGPESLGNWDDNLHLLGMLAVLGAALSYSLNSVFTRRVATQDDPMALATGMMLLATLIAIPAGLADVPDIVWPPGPIAWLALAVLGLICSGFAAVLYFRLIQGPGPAFTTLVTFLVPAWAVLSGAVVLQEHLPLRVYAGLALILGGIGLSEAGSALHRRVLRRRQETDRTALGSASNATDEVSVP